MDIKSYLGEYAQKSKAELGILFKEKRKEAKKVDTVATHALNILEEYLNGGKKVRGALTVLGYQLAGGKDLKAIMQPSHAVEILSSCLLIHDDFIDHDLTRRGKPTVHSTYAKINGDHYGASMAIVVADIGIFLSHQIFAESDFPKDRVANAISVCDKLWINTGYGELMDIEYDFDKAISWKEAKKIRIYKTAYYTFVTPLLAGAILAGASSKVIKAMEGYGESVGLAFQLRDDYLGVFGDTEKTGKSTDSDITEGKTTLFYIKALELTEKTDKDFLKKYYGQKNLDKKKIDKIRDIFKTSGALAYSDKKSAELVSKGKSYISSITKNKELQSLLMNLADFVISREK